MHVGVDVGVRRIAVGCANPPFSSSIDLGASGGHRQTEVGLLERWCRSLPLRGAHFWVEKPYMSSSITNPDTSIAMGETVGVIRTAFARNEVTMVHQSSWKAAVIGSGKADKAAVQAFLLEHHPELAALCMGVEDRYDAMAIGIYGTLVAEGTVSLPVPKAQRRRKQP